MATGRNRPITSLPMQDADQLDSSYREWQTRRPQLFHRRGTSVPMEALTKVCIFVIADVIANGHEEPVRVTNAQHGSLATLSLISKSKAIASHGSIRSTPSTKVMDHAGAPYSSSSSVSLRWYYDDGAETYLETFHIVDPAGNALPWDAVLRDTAEPPSRALTPSIHTHIFHPNPNRNLQREIDAAKRKELNEMQYKKETQDQTRKIRETVAARQGKPPKHGQNAA